MQATGLHEQADSPEPCGRFIYTTCIHEHVPRGDNYE